LTAEEFLRITQFKSTRQNTDSNTQNLNRCKGFNRRSIWLHYVNIPLVADNVHPAESKIKTRKPNQSHRPADLASSKLVSLTSDLLNSG